MCGIVGYVGHKEAAPILLKGLHQLEYRGYDSAGVALTGEGLSSISVFKAKGKVANLEEKVNAALGESGQMLTTGIGHTRWATHGGVTISNCHPVYSFDRKVILVHNGVIENFTTIRDFLASKGVSFYGNTDSEIIANLVAYLLKNSAKNMLEAIEIATSKLNGSYSLAIVHIDEPDRLYFAKNLSPLLIGKGEDANYLASDQIPMADISSQFVDLKDGRYGYIKKDEIHVYFQGNEEEYKLVERSSENLDVSLNGYPHFMLKEIEETPNCIERLIKNYVFNGEYTFDPKLLKIIERASEIIFLACGTSYHASLIAVDLLRSKGKLASAYIASEFAYHPIVMSKNPLFIIISQSGETADLLKCIPFIQDNAYHLLTITNNRYSSLARKAEYYLNLYSGVEVSVASTKVYQSELALLFMLLDATFIKGHHFNELREQVKCLEKIIAHKEKFIPVAEEIANYDNLFFLGRGIDYSTALEGALKMKEVTYINASAVQAGELKHGPIALISNEFPSIAFISEEKTAHQMRNGFQEIKARGGRVFVVSSKSLSLEDDDIIVCDSPLYLSPMSKVMVAQYLTYYTAIKKGLNVDKPRNLAKSVTVE